MPRKKRRSLQTSKQNTQTFGESMRTKCLAFTLSLLIASGLQAKFTRHNTLGAALMLGGVAGLTTLWAGVKEGIQGTDFSVLSDNRCPHNKILKCKETDDCTPANAKDALGLPYANQDQYLCQIPGSSGKNITVPTQLRLRLKKNPPVPSFAANTIITGTLLSLGSSMGLSTWRVSRLGTQEKIRMARTYCFCETSIQSILGLFLLLMPSTGPDLEYYPSCPYNAFDHPHKVVSHAGLDYCVQAQTEPLPPQSFSPSKIVQPIAKPMMASTNESWPATMTGLAIAASIFVVIPITCTFVDLIKSARRRLPPSGYHNLGGDWR